MDSKTRNESKSVRKHETAEESRRQSEERFDSIVDSVTDYAIFLLDTKGHIATWNKGAERLKGYKAGEIIGKHFSVFYTPDALASDWPKVELEHAKEEGRFEDEGWRIRKDGTRFWANVVITAIFDRSGNHSGFLKITRDLTERKAHEEALRQSEERFRLLVEGVKDYAIFMLDPDGRIVSWNEGARRAKGYRADEIIGRHFSIFYPPEALARHWPEYELQAATLEGRFEDEGWRIRKDGSRFWANVVITAIHGHDGKLLGFAKVTRDLTERRRVESLEEANHRMNEFLAMVSHELRTPLNSMLGWVRLIRAGRLDAKGLDRALSTIERNTLTQAQLIEDLLDVSRIVSGKLRLSITPINLDSPVQAAVDSVRPAAGAKDIQLQVAVSTAIGLVSGDEDRLQQVVWNLLSNAIKFTPKGGKVQLEVARVDSSVEITVSDTGSGIAPDLLPHIFERFRQGDASITRAHGGLGLGLSIVKALVEAHGGTVRAESEGANMGATFFVRLPVMPLSKHSARAAPVHIPIGEFECPPELVGVQILVVDDEPDTRDMLAYVLGECSAVVRTVASAAEALAVLDEWEADIIVSDIGMPGEGGYELIRKVRSRPGPAGDTPALALTAYARFEDRMQALRAGFQMHVSKPVEPIELIEVVRSLLQYRRPRLAN